MPGATGPTVCQACSAASAGADSASAAPAAPAGVAAPRPTDLAPTPGADPAQGEDPFMLGSAPPSAGGEQGLEGYTDFASGPFAGPAPTEPGAGAPAPPGGGAPITRPRGAGAPAMPRAFYTSGRPRRSSSPMVLYIVAGVLGLLILAAVAHFLLSGDAGDAGGSAQVDDSRARQYIAELVKGLAPVKSADEYYKEGRAAYLEDSAMGYRKAAKAFSLALARDADDGLALAGLVEAEVNDPAGRPDVERLQVLFELADHAVRLAPEEAATHRARAALLNAVGKRDEARMAGMQAKKLAVDNAEALVVLGETYLVDSPEVGIDYLEEARQKAPKLKRAITVLSEAYRRAGRTNDALKLLESRLAEDPSHVASLIAAADLLAMNGMFERARARYLEAIDAGHGAERAHLGLGILLYQGFGETKAALKHLRFVVEAARTGTGLPPKTACRLHVHLGILEREKGRLDAAEEHAKQALDLDPRYPPALYLMGDLYLRAGKVVEAKKNLDAVLDARPEFAPAIRKAGRVAEEMPDLERAVKLFNQAVHHDRYSAVGYVALAGLYARLQNNDQVYGVMHKSLQLPPDLGDGPTELTDFYDGPGDLDRAVEALHGLATEQPEQPAAHTAYGIALHWSGRFRESTQALQKALSLDANDFGARLYLAANLLRRRNVGAAEKEARKALAIERLNLAAGYVAGRIYEAKKDWKQAARRYEEVLDVDPAYLPVNLRYGLVKLRRGKKAEAEQMLKQVLVVQPANLIARRALFKAQ